MKCELTHLLGLGKFVEQEKFVDKQLEEIISPFLRSTENWVTNFTMRVSFSLWTWFISIHAKLQCLSIHEQSFSFGVRKVFFRISSPSERLAAVCLCYQFDCTDSFSVGINFQLQSSQLFSLWRWRGNWASSSHWMRELEEFPRRPSPSSDF